MIPLGYLAKRIAVRPEWLKVPGVREVCSLSACISEDFCDYINYWKHNGWWLFDSPNVIRTLAQKHKIDLNGTRFFYYEAFEQQYDEAAKSWNSYAPTEGFKTNVIKPANSLLLGYDVATYSLGNSPECSPLSCNHLAESIPVNEYCLLPSLEDARKGIDGGAFNMSEPGPFRIIAVYSISRETPSRAF